MSFFCWHRWVDPTNKAVKANGWLLCVKCGKLKPPRLANEH